MDYQFDETAGGRRLKILNVTDEFTREALASRVGRSIDAGATVKFLAELVRRRGAPIYVRCDNGPEFISEVLKRWCLGSGMRTSFIEPGAPLQNAFVESFNGRMREELLNLEVFDSLFEAKVLIEDWRVEYDGRVLSPLGLDNWPTSSALVHAVHPWSEHANRSRVREPLAG